MLHCTHPSTADLLTEQPPLHTIIFSHTLRYRPPSHRVGHENVPTADVRNRVIVGKPTAHHHPKASHRSCQRSTRHGTQTLQPSQRNVLRDRPTRRPLCHRLQWTTETRTAGAQWEAVI